MAITHGTRGIPAGVFPVTWSRLEGDAGRRGLVFTCGEPSGSRGLLLSRLAAETLGEHGAVLWITSRRDTTPLAWVAGRHRRLELEDESLPFDPLSLSSSSLMSLLCVRYGVRTRSQSLALAQALSRIEGEGRPDSLDELDRLLADAGVVNAQASSLPARTFASAERVFDAYETTTLVGTRAQVGSFAETIVLAAHAFVSAASSRPHKPFLLVVEDVWGILGPTTRDALRMAVQALLDNGRGRAVVAEASTRPMVEDLFGLALLGGAIPVPSFEYDGPWPEPWGSLRPELLEGVRYNRLVLAPAAPRRDGVECAWHWLAVPAPVDLPIPGVRVVDIGDNGVAGVGT